MNKQPGTRISETILQAPRKGDDIADRLLDLSVGVLEIATGLPDNPVGKHISRQLFRSGTSPGANYEEARCAESRADFIHKIAIATKEGRETHYWLRVVDRMRLSSHPRLNDHINQADQLIAILTKSRATARSRRG